MGLIIGVFIFLFTTSLLIYSQGPMAGDDREMYDVMLIFGNISAIAAIIGSASVIRAALTEGVSFFFLLVICCLAPQYFCMRQLPDYLN